MHERCRNHSNAFVELNGIPYLVAEYLDKRNIMQLDRGLIRSEIFIDQRESMRAIIDINIDDIGKHSDGTLNIRGNNTKQKDLLKCIAMNADRMNHQFDVLKRGIVMRVNYQLENQRTGQVLRSMTEDLNIKDRNYFIDVNPRDINDNPIITNFSSTMVSTINEFTHGSDPMILRITNVQMLYKCLKRDPSGYRLKQIPGPWENEPELDYYNYHEKFQNRQYINADGVRYNRYGFENPDMISPPTWSMYNRYYHFDNNGHTIIFHEHEILDHTMRPVFVPCGTVQVNRAFMINPGHRLIFKFSVWKNDLIVVNDTFEIARAIQTPYINGFDYPCHTDPIYLDDCYNHHYHYHHDDYEFDDLFNKPSRPIHDDSKMIEALRRENRRQNETIEKLVDSVNALRDIIAKEHSEVEIPDAVIPTIPDAPKPPRPPHRPGDNPLKKKLDAIEELLKNLKNQSSSEEDYDHFIIENQIADIQKELDDIRENGTDEVVASRLEELTALINDIQFQINSDQLEPIPSEKVDELLDKIQDS